MPEPKRDQSALPDEFANIATICTATEIEIGGETILGVADARNLHSGLRVKTPFGDWIKRRIRQLRLAQGIDFQSYSQNCEKPSGGAPTKVYRLSLDAAKHIAMAERTKVGTLVRRYFLWCERRAFAAATDEADLINRAARMRDPEGVAAPAQATAGDDAALIANAERIAAITDPAAARSYLIKTGVISAPPAPPGGPRMRNYDPNAPFQVWSMDKSVTVLDKAQQPVIGPLPSYDALWLGRALTDIAIAAEARG